MQDEMLALQSFRSGDNISARQTSSRSTTTKPSMPCVTSCKLGGANLRETTAGVSVVHLAVSSNGCPRNRVFSGLLVLLLICTVLARPTTIRIETDHEDGARVGFGGRNLIMTTPAKTPAGGMEVVIHHSDQPIHVHIGAEPRLDTDAYRRTLAATLCHNNSCSYPPIHWNKNNTYKIKRNIKKLLRSFYTKLNANKWD